MNSNHMCSDSYNNNYYRAINCECYKNLLIDGVATDHELNLKAMHYTHACSTLAIFGLDNL